MVCFLQPYWGVGRGCVPAGVCCYMEAGSSRSVLLCEVVPWRGAVCLLCDLWNVPPCPSLSLVWLRQDHQIAQHNLTGKGISGDLRRGRAIEKALL